MVSTAIGGQCRPFPALDGIAEQRHDAVPLEAAFGRQAAQLDQRREQILALGQGADVATAADPAGRPSDEARHAVATFPELYFVSSHARVENPHADCSAVVAQEDEDLVVAQAGLCDA